MISGDVRQAILQTRGSRTERTENCLRKREAQPSHWNLRTFYIMHKNPQLRWKFVQIAL